MKAGLHVHHPTEGSIAGDLLLTAAAAGGAFLRFGAGAGPASAAFRAVLRARHPDLLRTAIEGLLQGYLKIVTQVFALLRPRRAAAPKITEATKNILEDASKIAEATKAAETAGPNTFIMTKMIVALPPLGIGENLVSLVDRLELFLGPGISFVEVRMITAGQLAVSPFDLVSRGAPLDPRIS